MGKLTRNILITLSIFFLLTFIGKSENVKCNSLLVSDLVPIYGRVIVMEENNFPKIIKNVKKDFTNSKIDISRKIIALRGKVPRLDSNPYIPIRSLNFKYQIIETNPSGEFETCLKKGTFTFFIIDGKNAYLNLFDGKGFFKEI